MFQVADCKELVEHSNKLADLLGEIWAGSHWGRITPDLRSRIRDALLEHDTVVDGGVGEAERRRLDAENPNRRLRNPDEE